MSKKVDHPELRAQLETLNNKELHNKCVEHGMNVPVADSTRDVIIRKLIKSITGEGNVASPKINKKKSSTPNDRRKTVNVTVHVSSDEEESRRQSRPQITKTRTRTQSPKGYNVTFDASTSNNNQPSRVTPTATSSPITRHQNFRTQRVDPNANSGVGLGSNARILPIEVDLNNVNPVGGYTSNLGYSQTRNTTSQQVLNNISPQGFPFTHYADSINQPQGDYWPGSSPAAFNNANKASHSSTHGGQYGSGASPPTQEPLFKHPTVLSKTHVTNTSYDQYDAQRLYPRLPTDLATPPSYTSLSPSTTSPESKESSRSNRAPSLNKSGVMTTSYYQEISPVKEVKHYEEETGDEPAVVGTRSRDFNLRNNANSGANYQRSSYLSGIQRGAEPHLPFQPHFQSTLHDAVDATPHYSTSPLAPSASALNFMPSQSLSKRYTGISRGNTSYTRSIDEPDSGSENEKLSGDEIYVQDSEDEEYLPENKKIYSSFGSNKIQERVPYRRSNASRLNASPNRPYNQTAMEQRLYNQHSEDDVNVSLRNFLTTLDRKYHIKEMLYMFAIFATAVFIYVMFIEKTPSDDAFVASKVHP